MSTTVGGFDAKAIRMASPPRVAVSSSLTIFTTCWAGFSAPESSSPTALADAALQRLDDRQVDVGLEEGEADLSEHLINIGLGELSLAAQLGEDAFKTVGQ